ncbi:MAG: PIN domain nuclease [Candidatus Aminicenantes bacterium]|nr:PIN domain nuclease [Candidatus Aminicenantes bacterium]
MVLVDSSVIIDFINENKYKEVIISLLSKKEFLTTEIIMMEVLQGIRDDKTYDKIKSFLESLPLVEIKYGDYIEAANIYRTCRRKGITIRKSIDCIIAAAAINNDLELISKGADFDNIRKHFALKRFNE